MLALDRSEREPRCINFCTFVRGLYKVVLINICDSQNALYMIIYLLH
jgi:hypothetical protein